MAEPTPTRYARSPDGDRIAYRTLGHGGVPIIVFHTSTCVDLWWDDPVYAGFMNRLAQAGQVITFDWRGLGASERLPRGEFPTLEAWGDDARAVLDAVGAVRAFVLTYDLLAPWGLVFAATNPRYTAGLVIVDGHARFLWAEDYRFGLDGDVVDRYLDALMDRLVTPDGVWAETSDDPPRREMRARAQRLSCPPGWGRELNKWAVRADARSVLDLILCPTLIVQPTRHPYKPREFSEYLAEHIGGARLVRRTGAGDILFSECDSEEVADLVHEFVTGTPPTYDHDRALATVLFTDIVGSTTHASRIGDQAWVALLAQHDAIIDRELRRHRGRKVNPTGDGMVATFDGPARAVHCAQAISDGVRDLGLDVRAGLHTGEIQQRASDVGGIAVHIAARISALARPGEILVSRTVTDLALGSGLTFDDRGEHDLKGVPGTWHLYSVVA